MIEERLGRAGRPLTTLVVLCVALGLIAWGVKLFIDNAILPLSDLIKHIITMQGITPDVIWRPLISFGIYITLVIISLFIAKQYIHKKLLKSVKSTLKDTINLNKEVQDTHEETIALAKEVQEKLEESISIREEAKQILAEAELNIIENNEQDNEAPK